MKNQAQSSDSNTGLGAGLIPDAEQHENGMIDAAKSEIANTASEVVLARFSVVTKSKGPLTKIMRLDGETGKIIKDGNQCFMSRGKIQTKKIKSFAQFASGLRKLATNQALVHGICEHSTAMLTTKEKLAREQANRAPDALPIIAKTKDFIDYPAGPSLFMFDHDKARDNAVATDDSALKSYRPEELIGVIAKFMPKIADAGSVSTPSTSSSIFDKAGKELRGEGSGSHIYFVAEDGRDIPRFGKVLGQRLFLAGYGRFEFSRSSALLERTLVDLSVFSPERLDFAAGAVCEDGLVQKLSDPVVKEGTRLNTAMLSDLNESEEAELKAIIQRLKVLAAPTQEVIRSEYIDSESQKLVKAQGIDLEEARTIIEARQDHVLIDGDLLYFQHLKEPVTVGEVLDNHAAFDKRPLADPLEPEYDGGSKTKARFYWNDGKPVVNSFAHGQIKYTFQRFAETKNEKEIKAPKFKFISSCDLVLAPPQWLIKDYLEREVTVTMFGAPGSTKTFVAMDMGLSVSTGIDWQRHKVKRAPVLYVCGEGKAGIKKRITAWERHHGVKAPDFFVSTCAAQMLNADNVQEIEYAANEVKTKAGAPALLIIDTLNRNFGNGDENSTEDMTKYIQSVDRLKDQLQCSILTVHHTGLADANRSRGSSALKGAMDFEYVVEKTGDTLEEQLITLMCTKAKDFDAPPKQTFKPVLIDLGLLDDEMRPVTSLVLELTDEQPATKRKKLSLSNQIALDALKALVVHGEDASEVAWRQECYSRGITTADTPDAKKKAFARARRFLIENFYIQTRDDFYWLCRSEKDAGQGGQNGPERDMSRSGPHGGGDRQGQHPKGLSLVPLWDANLEDENATGRVRAFQHFNDDIGPADIEHSDIPEMEQGDLTDDIFAFDEQEDEDAIYI